MIIINPADVRSKINQQHPGELKKVITTSGGYDPLHIGHLRSILQAKQAAEEAFGYTKFPIAFILVVIVNGTNFLIQKKGFEFMPLMERIELIDGLKDVDIVTTWDQIGDDYTVNIPLQMIKPHFFVKGGDRIPGTVAEEATLQEWKGKVLYGVGGENKLQSSSSLIENVFSKSGIRLTV